MRGVIVSACIVAAMMLAVYADTKEAEKLYIVHMDKSQMPSAFLTHHDWYKSVVLSAVDLNQQADVGRKLVYTYNIAMHGFSALLTPAELEAVRALPGYVESHEDTGRSVLHTEDIKQRWEWVPRTRSGRRLQTTNSYEFLGLSENQGLWPQSEFGHANDIVVGVVDTGIWPESLSFRDDGMGPVPRRWKGICQPGVRFPENLCNRKLIGARYFHKGFFALGKKFNSTNDYNSSRDYIGHGTFTTSIIAGQAIPNANVYKFGSGIAKGMAPRVRVAMYKVAWSDPSTPLGSFISDSDVWTAMEQAISDGVDIISISLVSPVPIKDYVKDPTTYSSLNAVQNGVLVVAGGGNEGPKASTVRNDAPWMLTVGATTIDRAFLAIINLGHGQVIMKGTSLYTRQISTPYLTLVSGSICEENSLEPKYVTGNILFCEDSTDVPVETRITVAQTTGAIAAIIAYDDAVSLRKDIYVLPIVFVNANQSEAIVDYISSYKAPIASVQFHITELGYAPAAMLGSFSSVGPSVMFPEILKPDLVAPGVNIIASCINSRRSSQCFSMSSGTSNSAPHVAGIAALLKAAHPFWSPAAIKSALMTTADRLDNTGQRISSANKAAPALSPLDIGCGHINPEIANNPGLVYDMDHQDYVKYLCLTKRKKGSDCRNAAGSPYDLNLPTFTTNFLSRTEAGKKQVRSFKRVLTNFGGGGDGEYNSFAYMTGGIIVSVTPETLVFNHTNQRLQFTLTVEIPGPYFVTDTVREGVLTWYDNSDSGDSHQLTSPIVLIFPDNL